jgi:hypothetical protein
MEKSGSFVSKKQTQFKANLSLLFQNPPWSDNRLVMVKGCRMKLSLVASWYRLNLPKWHKN